MLIFGILGAVASLAAGFAGANAAKAEAQAAQNAATYKAQEDAIKGRMARAEAQRNAMEKRRQGDLASSTLQARAAASGASASDEGIQALGGDIAARSEYAAGLETYKGEAAARGYAVDAQVAQMEANAKKVQAKYAATGSILNGIGGFAKSIGSSFGSSGSSGLFGSSYG